MLQAGADVNLANGYGDTPMYQLLRNKPDAKKVQALLQGGADVSHDGRSGFTPLLTATAYKLGLAVLQVLLQAGANLDTRNQDGKTALDLAIRHGDAKTIELLMNARAATPSS